MLWAQPKGLHWSVLRWKGVTVSLSVTSAAVAAAEERERAYLGCALLAFRDECADAGAEVITQLYLTSCHKWSILVKDSSFHPFVFSFSLN